MWLKRKKKCILKTPKLNQCNEEQFADRMDGINELIKGI